MAGNLGRYESAPQTLAEILTQLHTELVERALTLHARAEASRTDAVFLDAEGRRVDQLAAELGQLITERSEGG